MNEILDSKTQALLAECCARRGVPLSDMPAIKSAMENVCVHASMWKLFQSGEMEIAGIKNGQLLWASAPKGKQRAAGGLGMN